MAKKYYAVQKGRKPGIYETWSACEAQVKGFSGAVYKSFPTLSEAQSFIGDGIGLGTPDTSANNVATSTKSASTAGNSKNRDASSTSGSTSGSLADYFARNTTNYATTNDTNNTANNTTKKAANSTNNSTNTSVIESHPAAEGAGLVAYIDGSYDKHNGKVGSGGVIFYDNKTWEFSFGTADPFYTNYWNVSGELLGAMYVMKEAKRMGANEVHLYYDYMGIEMWATGRWKTNNPLTQHYAAFCKEYKPHMKVHYHKVAAHTGVIYNERADQLAKAGTKK